MSSLNLDLLCRALTLSLASPKIFLVHLIFTYIPNFSWPFGTKYSRIDQVKFVEDSLRFDVIIEKKKSENTLFETVLLLASCYFVFIRCKIKIFIHSF